MGRANIYPCSQTEQRKAGERKVKNAALRGAVMSRFRSYSDFAKALGWSTPKVSRIVNGTQDPDVKDMKHMINVLGIKDAGEIVALFSLR